MADIVIWYTKFYQGVISLPAMLTEVLDVHCYQGCCLKYANEIGHFLFYFLKIFPKEVRFKQIISSCF